VDFSTDAPIFEPDVCGLDADEGELAGRARKLAATRVASRA
jgi:hypothetical protein